MVVTHSPHRGILFVVDKSHCGFEYNGNEKLSILCALELQWIIVRIHYTSTSILNVWALELDTLENKLKLSFYFVRKEDCFRACNSSNSLMFHGTLFTTQALSWSPGSGITMRDDGSPLLKPQRAAGTVWNWGGGFLLLSNKIIEITSCICAYVHAFLCVWAKHHRVK